MKYGNRWFILSLIISLGFLLLVFANPEHGLFSRMFFSSDMIYNSIIFNDIFVDGTGVNGWHLNAAPNFFPDMFVYFILMSLFRDIHIVNFVFVILQYLAFLYLTFNLFRIVAGERSKRYSTLFVLLNLLFLVIPIFTNRYLLSFNFTSISYHFGAVIMAMASFNFLFAYFRYRKTKFLIWLAGFIILGTISDRLYIIHFVIPTLSLVIFFFKKETLKKLWNPTLPIILVTVLGLFIFRMIRISKGIHIISTGFKMYNFDNLAFAWERFSIYMKSLLKNSPENIILLIGIIAFLLSAFFIIRNLIRFYKNKALESEQLPFYLVVIFTVFIPVVLFTPVINGAFIGPAIIRFNFMAIAMGLILFPLLLMTWEKTRIHSDRVLRYFLPVSSLALALVFIIRISSVDFIPGLKDYFNYYPRTAEVLDKLKDEYDLKFGLTEYWEAKNTMAYSNNDLRVYTVMDNSFKPWYHTTNENWYHSGGKGKYKDPVFNFISLGKFKHTEAVTEIFGNSMDTIYYDKDMVVVKVPEFTFDRRSRNVVFLE